jgi:DNA/RNA endonuclease YhcR with UshA esterase domain
MKRWTVAWLVVGIVAAATVVFAQNPRRGTQGPRGARNYNPATETTFTGTVADVQTASGPGNGPGGLHLTVRNNGETEDVRLGPASYIQSKNFTFVKGDSVTVTGSKTTVNGQQVVIAREIKKGDQVLTLRDKQGIPLWSGRGRRSSTASPQH